VSFLFHCCVFSSSYSYYSSSSATAHGNLLPGDSHGSPGLRGPCRVQCVDYDDGDFWVVGVIPRWRAGCQLRAPHDAAAV
jgi:hypothetical protein